MANQLTVKEAIEARRSIRRYTDEKISPETIHELIRQANLAPTPWNLQPTRIVAVTDPETKSQLMAAAYGQPQVGAAPVVFVIYTDMEDVLSNVHEVIHPGMPEDRRAQEAETIGNTIKGMGAEAYHAWGKNHGYTFMAFLLLAAQSMGYSTSAMLGFEPDKVRELFNLPQHAQFPAIVAMGVAAEDGFTHHRHSSDRITTFA